MWQEEGRREQALHSGEQGRKRRKGGKQGEEIGHKVDIRVGERKEKG